MYALTPAATMDGLSSWWKSTMKALARHRKQNSASSARNRRAATVAMASPL